MEEVLELITVREAWLALEAAFAHPSKSREIQLKNELLLLQHGTHSVAYFSRSFKALCAQLAQIKCPVDETNKVHWFLRALGTDFAHFATTILSQTLLPHLVELIPKAISQELFAQLIVNPSFTTGAFAAQQVSSVSKDMPSKSCSAGSSRRSSQKSNDLGQTSSGASDLSDSEWYPDSGATAHMTNNCTMLEQPVSYTGGNERVFVGSDNKGIIGSRVV